MLIGTGSAILAAVGALAAYPNSFLRDGLIIVSAILASTAAVFNYRAWVLGRYRRLEAFQRAALLQDLRQLPSVPIRVTAVAGDREALLFARELYELLLEAGWLAEGGF